MAKYSELVLDTNFLIEATKRRVLDQAREAVPGAKLVTLEAVVDELRAQGQKLALKIVEAEGIEVKPVKGYADHAIVNYAKKETAVATNDRELGKKLKAKGTAVVCLTKHGCELDRKIV